MAALIKFRAPVRTASRGSLRAVWRLDAEGRLVRHWLAGSGPDDARAALDLAA